MSFNYKLGLCLLRSSLLLALQVSYFVMLSDERLQASLPVHWDWVVTKSRPLLCDLLVTWRHTDTLTHKHHILIVAAFQEYTARTTEVYQLDSFKELVFFIIMPIIRPINWNDSSVCHYYI